jgi:ElaB/YqjD/DUF883 family membrane-anchored ribosome-binding protein
MSSKKTKQFMQDLAKAKRKAKMSFAKAKAKLIHAEKKVMSYVDKNPRKAAAIAVGVGAAIGAIAATALRRRK